ncbi:hypothetical protein SLS53_007392 [Cytospora paraplurivora]|uniref:Uncharacterized protein n=1 Tax=Cytospora paraplurivora TaxID=2898453 RepID=A0AAN9YD59_9PEZI
MADNSHPDGGGISPGNQASSDQSVASTSPPRVVNPNEQRADQAEKQVDWEKYTASPTPTEPNGMYIKNSKLTALLTQESLNDDRAPTGEAGFAYAEAIICQIAEARHVAPIVVMSAWTTQTVILFHPSSKHLLEKKSAHGRENLRTVERIMKDYATALAENPTGVDIDFPIKPNAGSTTFTSVDHVALLSINGKMAGSPDLKALQDVKLPSPGAKDSVDFFVKFILPQWNYSWIEIDFIQLQQDSGSVFHPQEIG